MNKLLTIAIPTFNRAQLLDIQLTWLAKAIKGFESDCEIFISDNCSTDNTQEIIKKWQIILSNVTFTSNINNKNIGVMGNIACCLKAANSKYVWTIGDDDPIQDRAITYVISKLKQHEDLSLLFLNFSGRNQITGEPVHPPTIVGNRWFDVDSEDGDGDGKAIFEHCFSKSVGAVIFLSATVYRTDLIKRALQSWPDAENNWISLAYLAGYCAANGIVIVTKETYLECIVGVSYWQKEPKSALLMQYKHIPEVILKLEKSGYSKQFCRRMILQNRKEVSLKVFLGALRRWPMSAIKTVVPFLTLVSLCAFDLMVSKEFGLAESSEISTQEVRLYKP
ncbi:glycosyltransferase family 2 protein [Nostoc sp. WHI]|uniref:glycosyltransferase family 2 protein n=1 Tax=Nostoc sp. WHI TaxID=2650611 RepID=UPI0018C726D9|nr:glycosyltransferase family 2 protein [Nostoc sp. WHI]MBG1270055.1 glycosyltransferase family 2 protein [Nostoc sp. WHI]